MTEPALDPNITPIQPPIQKPSSPWLTIVLIVLVILSLACMSFLFWQNQQLSKQLMVVSQPTSPTLTKPTPIPSADPTTNWKTFNGKLFSFKYPSDWVNSSTKKANPNDVILKSQDSAIGFSVNINLNGFGLECYKPTGQTIKTLFNGKEKSVDVYQGISNEMCSIKDEKMFGFSEEYTTNNYAFFMTYKANEETSATNHLNQILSTFKFTK